MVSGIWVRAGAWAAAVAALASACESPVPFYRSGASPGTVAGLGVPAPHVPLSSPRPGARPSVPEPGRVPWSVYAGAGPGMLAPAVRGLPARVYVPSGRAVLVLDQYTFRVVRKIEMAGRPRQVVAAPELRRLWAAAGDRLVPLDPRTGRPGPAVRVPGADELYFTPDGRTALLTAAERGRISFRDAATMRPRGSVAVPCRGVGRADFSADGSVLVAACTSPARLVAVEPARRRLRAVLDLGDGADPRDVRLAPDGRSFQVAAHGGLWTIDTGLHRKAFTGIGGEPFGLVPSRDARMLYVIGGDTVWVLDYPTMRRVRRWHLPHGSRLSGGGVDAYGDVLWLSGDRTVHAVAVRTGRLIRTIDVPAPHGDLNVHPQPGTHSLGRTLR